MMRARLGDKLRRYASLGLTGVLLVAACVAAGLWPVSAFYSSSVTYVGRGWSAWASSFDGMIGCHVETPSVWNEPRGWYAASLRLDAHSGTAAVPDVDYTYDCQLRVPHTFGLGIRHRRGPGAVETDLYTAIAAHWLLAAACGAWPACRAWRWTLARRRRRRGLCPSCGYDLRASSGPCPECWHTQGPL